MAVTFCNRCTSGHYHDIWTGPYHVIVPATEMTRKVLRKMTINHKCNSHFCSKDMCFSSALSPCVKLVLEKHGYIADLL